MRDGENREAAIVDYGDCVHVHPSDPANALVALDAKISVRGKDGTREISAADFLRAPTAKDKRMNVLEPNEMITNLQLPTTHARSAYLKAMDRATWMFALASAAVRLDVRDGVISGARVVIGGVAPVPWREHRAEEILVGLTKISETVAARATEGCLRDAKPLAHNAYKVRLARAMVKRAILQCAD